MGLEVGGFKCCVSDVVFLGVGGDVEDGILGIINLVWGEEIVESSDECYIVVVFDSFGECV